MIRIKIRNREILCKIVWVENTTSKGNTSGIIIQKVNAEKIAEMIIQKIHKTLQHMKYERYPGKDRIKSETLKIGDILVKPSKYYSVHCTRQNSKKLENYIYCWCLKKKTP